MIIRIGCGTTSSVRFVSLIDFMVYILLFVIPFILCKFYLFLYMHRKYYPFFVIPKVVT